jgi:hypothetical protein
MNTAYVDFLKRRNNLKSMGVEDIVDNAKILQKQTGNENDAVLSKLQTKDKQILEKVGEQEVAKPNPAFQTELEHDWNLRVIEKEDLEKQIYDLNQKTKGLQNIQVLNDVKAIREKIALLDEMPNVESITFNKQLEQSGIDLSKIDMDKVQKLSTVMHNPLGARNLSLDQMEEHLKYLRDKGAVDFTDQEIPEVALRLKGSADNAIKQIETDLPELAPYYTGTTVQDGREVAKHGIGKDKFEDVRNKNADYEVQKQEALSANTYLNAYGLNFSGKDTGDMAINDLQALRDTLAKKVEQYTKEGKTKLLEKAQADLEAVDKQFADIKSSSKAPKPSYVKESPVGLESDFERINKIKELPDIIVKKALKRDTIGELSKEEIANLEKVKHHYDNLISKGFYPEAINKMSVGSIINKSNEFLNPDLGRALSLIPTPTKNGMNEETYRSVRKAVENTLKKGINPYNNKRMVVAKDFEEFVNEFVRKNNILGLKDISNQEKFLDEGGTLFNKSRHTDKELIDTSFDKVDNKLNTEKTVYGQKRKLADVNNPGVKRTVEEIQKLVPDFSIDTAKRMTAIDLTNLMNGLKKGKIDPQTLSVKGILDNLGSSNQSPVRKLIKEADIYKNTDFSNVTKGDKEFLHFDTPNGKVNIDSNAKPKAIEALTENVMNKPEELKGVQQNVNTTLVNGEIGDIMHKDGSFKAQGMYLNDEGKNVIISDGGDTMKVTSKSFDGTINHETAHAFGNNAWHADRTASKIKGDITSWTPEQKKQAVELFKNVSRLLGDGKGHITTYIDKLKDAKATKTVMNQETLAEFGTVFLHSDPAIRNKARELFPQGSKMMDDLIAKLPKENIDKIVPKGISAREELVSKLENYKDYVDLFDNTNKEDLIKKGVLEDRLKEVDNLVKNSEAHKEWFKEKYKDVPEFIKVMEPINEVKDTISAFDGLSEEARKGAEFIRSEFKKFGIEENIDPKHLDELYNYFPRVLNFDLRDKPKYKTIFDDLHNPTNQNAKSREFMVGKTIEEVNKIMKEKHGIDNFFENNVVRAYVDRALNNNEFMFKKDVTEKSMNLFGKQIDKSAYEGLSKEGKKALYEEVQAMVDSGEYDFVRLDDKLKKSELNVVGNEALNKAKEDLSSFNPYVHIDPKDINLKEVFEKAEQPVWLVKKDTHEMLKQVAIGQFRQSHDGLLKVVDKFNSLWKTNALFSMSFNFNNMMGNTFNNYLSVGTKVFNPKLNATALAIDFENPVGSFMGKSNKEWRKIAEEFGVLGHDFNAEIQDFRKGVTDNIGKSPLKKLASGVNPLSQDFLPYRGARLVSGTIESQARLVNFLAHVQDGKTYQEAADMVNKFLFDYNDLTDFEHNVMKRIVPFYTWMRKNFPLQITNLFNQPAKYGKIYRAQRDMSKPESEEQKALRPDYLDSAIHLGDGKYLNPNLPYNDLKKMTSSKDLFSSANPILKLAVEIGTNKNVYYNTPIAKQEGATVDAPAYMKPFAKQTPDGLKVDAKLRHIFRNMFPALENASNAIESADEGATTSKKEKALGWMTGLRTYTTDTGKLKQQAVFDYIKKLQDLEAKAKSEGYITKTAQQIQDAKEKEAQQQKINDIYAKNRAYVDNIYNNNYVIKKKK